MTYIELINNFWRLNEEYCFTPNETKLYFALLNMSNRFNWKQSFNQSNEYLAVQCGITKPTLIKARNTLRQKGLIEFKSEAGRRNNTEYKIIGAENYQSENNEKRLNNFTISDTFSDTISETISDTKCGQNSLHNIRLKKENKIKTNVLLEKEPKYICDTSEGENFSEEDFSEEKKLTSKPPKEAPQKKVAAKKSPPSFDEFWEYTANYITEKNIGNPENFKVNVEAKYNAWIANKWKDGNDKPIANWKTKIQNTLPFIKPIYGTNKQPTANRQKPFANSEPRTTTGTNRKVSARQLLARELEKATAQYNDGENFSA